MSMYRIIIYLLAVEIQLVFQLFLLICFKIKYNDVTMCISVSVYVYFLQGGVGLGQESWVLRIVYLSCRAQGTLTLNPKSLGSDKHCSIINVSTHCVHKSTALT